MAAVQQNLGIAGRPVWRSGVLCVALVAALLSTGTAVAQSESFLERTRRQVMQEIQRNLIPTQRLTNGPHVQAAFREVVAEAHRATVLVLRDGDQVALGGIVAADGWILTKASQLDGDEPIVCELSNGETHDARIVGMNRQWDLAMLKIETDELPVVPWTSGEPPQVGQWVATADVKAYPVSVGVVGVALRSIPKPSGILGIGMEQVEQGPRIERIYSDSGAEQAGLLVNDVVTHVNGKPTPTMHSLAMSVRNHAPGETVELTVLRGDEQLKVKATLSARLEDEPPSRRDFQNSLGGDLSERREDFPSVLQHDGALRPHECGGPLVDLEGKVIGWNIARAGRTESYAVPTQVLLTLLPELMKSESSPGDTVQATGGESPDTAVSAGSAAAQ
jgi:serine protease Do